MRHSGIFLNILLLILLPFFSACGRPVIPAGGGHEVAAGSTNQIRKDILKLINEYRRDKGLAALELTEAVEQVADEHSADMAAGRTPFGHGGFDARYKELNKKIGIKAMAENVAFGKIGAEKVVDLWLSSSGHRKNIEGNFKYTGIGIAKDKTGQLYFTQIFVLK